jgi:hypothetical protein
MPSEYYIAWYSPTSPGQIYGPVYHEGAQNLCFVEANGVVVAKNVFSGMTWRVDNR